MKLALAHADTALANIRAADMAPMQSQISAAFAPFAKIDTALIQRNLAVFPIQRLAEQIRRSVTAIGEVLRIEVESLARRMATKSELEDAAAYLVAAAELHEESEDELDSPRVIHDSVGALEELARQLAGKPTITLDSAIRILIRRRRISQAEGDWMLEAYRIRGETPGAGHGAGRAPKLVAHFVLFRVQRAVRLLLDRFDIGETAPN